VGGGEKWAKKNECEKRDVINLTQPGVEKTGGIQNLEIQQFI